MTASLPQLALFDLDNTLLAGDSDFEWRQFLIAQGVLDAQTHEAKNLEFFRQYQAGKLDIDEFLEFQLEPLTRFPRAQLDAWVDEFVATRIRPIITEPARALLRSHRDAGALCALVTATNSFVTGPIAREFGFEHLIATVPALADGERGEVGGTFSGKPRGAPAFREGKVARVTAWLETLGLYWGSFAETWFYSDSQNDLPLLRHVDHPVAVDPDSALRSIAEASGWPVLSLREAAPGARNGKSQ